MADTLCSENMIGPLRQVCDRWLYTCLHFGLPLEEQRQPVFITITVCFKLSIVATFSFKRGCQLEQCFQGLIDRTRTQLDIKRLKTIFG